MMKRQIKSRAIAKCCSFIVWIPRGPGTEEIIAVADVDQCVVSAILDRYLVALSRFQWFRPDNTKVGIFVLVLLNKIQIAAALVAHAGNPQRGKQAERQHAGAGIEFAQRHRVGTGELCSADDGVDVMMCDVINPVIFIARCSTFRVLFRAMKSRPEAAIGVAVTKQQYFFRRNQRNPERVVLKDKFVVALAVDERSEKARTVGIIEIDQRAQLHVAPQGLAQ